MEKFEITEEIFSYGKTVMLDGQAIFDFFGGFIFCISKDGTKDIAVFKLKK